VSASLLMISAGLFGAGGSVSADPVPDTSASALDYVIAYPSITTRDGMATFYPTGPIDPETVVVIAEADGTLPGGMTESQVADKIALMKQATPASEPMVMEVPSARASTGWIGGGGCQWGPVAHQNGPSIAGDGNTRVTYTWWQDTGRGSNGRAQGFYRGYYGSDMGIWEKWYDMGSTTPQASALVRGRVPWQGVWAVPKFQGQSTVCGFSAQGGFRATAA
jgi:hypothetical protein